VAWWGGTVVVTGGSMQWGQPREAGSGGERNAGEPGARWTANSR
jgi:hypothetical protein